MYHTLVLKPTNAWKFAFESRIAPARCGETAVCDLRGAPVKRRCALFHRALRFRKVYIMKLSHFRGSLHCLTPGVHSISHGFTRGDLRPLFRTCLRVPRAEREWFPRRSVHFGRSGCGGFDSKSVDRLSSFQDLASSRRARSFFSAPLYASLPSNSRNGGLCSCVSRTIA